MRQSSFFSLRHPLFVSRTSLNGRCNATLLKEMITKRAADLLSYLEEVNQEMIEFLRRLVEIETPSSDPESQEAAFALLEAEISRIGYSCRHIPGTTSGGQFYAEPANSDSACGRQLLLGHVDTVWPMGTLKTMPFSIEGNVARGPGIYDMKAGLTQTVFALRALRALGVEPGVVPLVLVSSDEELGSEDSRETIEQIAREVERVWVVEPSFGDKGDLKTARKGVGTFTFEVTGRAAHAGIEPEKGVSAVLAMASLIQELESLSDFKAGISVTVGLVSGGTAVNVVPAAASATVDVRIPTLADAQRIDKAIRSLRPKHPEANLEIGGGLERPPLERTAANRTLWNLAQRLGCELGLELGESATGGGSDGNFTSIHTGTLDGLGAVGGGAHALHEFIYLDRLAERTALLALLLAEPSLR